MYFLDPRETRVLESPPAGRTPRFVGMTGLGATSAPQTGLDLFTSQSIQVNPALLLVGIAFGAIALFLLGTRQGPKRARRKRATVEKKISKLRQELRKLEDES